MAYNTKNIIRDAAGAPIPQVYNPTTDQYEVLQGRNGANRVELYGPDGNPIGTTSGKLNVRASEIEALAGALTDAAVTDPAASASVIALSKGLLKQLQGAGTGAAPVQLTGSSIQDSQAVPSIQAKKDVAMRAYEGIIDVIGAENIEAFLTMGDTGSVIYDLFDRDLQFNVYGVSTGQWGPLPCVTFDGNDDWMEWAPETSNRTGNTDEALNNGTYLWAQKTAPINKTFKLGFVWLNLKVVGSVSQATLQVEIREDSGGVPAASPITNGTSEILAYNSAYWTTDYRWWGFAFATPPTLVKRKQYWIVLKYVSATGIDTSNYVAWNYDNVGAYGQPKAVYDGTTWTVTSGQSRCFDLYTDRFRFNDMGIIALAKATGTGAVPIASRPCSNNQATLTFYFRTVDYLLHFIAQTSSSLIDVVTARWPIGEWHVFALTVAQATSTDKLKGYLDGKKIVSGNGTAGDAVVTPQQPLVFGRSLVNAKYDSPFFAHSLGPVIYTKTAPTDAQIAKITAYLLGLRKRLEAV